MTFLAIGWLTLFGPWAWIVWRSLRSAPGSATATGVFLWPADRPSDLRRARRLPPIPVLLALIAAAIVIVALAEPYVSKDRPRIVAVIDPHIEVDPTDAWHRLSTRAEVELVVPGQPDVRTLDQIRRTARTTRAAVEATVARFRSEGRDVAVIGPTLPRTRAFCIPAMRLRPAVVIDRIAARGNDLLVRLSRRDLSTDGQAQVLISSGDESSEWTVRWALGKRVADEIRRWDTSGDVIEARTGDAFGQIARLARDERKNVRLTLSGDSPATIARLADAYARARPITPSRPAIDVLLTPDPATQGPAIVFADATGIAAGSTRTVPHAAIDATAFAELSLPGEPGPMPSDFTATAWSGERPVLGIRERPARAVWIACDLERSSRETAWVVLIDRAIQWVADAGDEWSSVTSDAVPAVGWQGVKLDEPSVEASPGLYRDADGRLIAVNAVAGADDPNAVRATQDDASMKAWLEQCGRSQGEPLAGRVAAFAATIAGLSAALVGRSALPSLAWRSRRLDDRAGTS